MFLFPGSPIRACTDRVFNDRSAPDAIIGDGQYREQQDHRYEVHPDIRSVVVDLFLRPLRFPHIQQNPLFNFKCRAFPFVAHKESPAWLSRQSLPLAFHRRDGFDEEIVDCLKFIRTAAH